MFSFVGATRRWSSCDVWLSVSRWRTPTQKCRHDRRKPNAATAHPSDHGARPRVATDDYVYAREQESERYTDCEDLPSTIFGELKAHFLHGRAADLLLDFPSVGALGLSHCNNSLRGTGTHLFITFE